MKKTLKFKEECGITYYREETEILDESGFGSGAGVVSKWKVAGRTNHPLTNRYIALLKGETDENTCICRRC